MQCVGNSFTFPSVDINPDCMRVCVGGGYEDESVLCTYLMVDLNQFNLEFFSLFLHFLTIFWHLYLMSI